MSERLEVARTAGTDWAVVVTFFPIERVPLGSWHETWTHRAAERVIDRDRAGAELTEYMRAEGDGLYGHGGRVHVRLEGEPEYQPAPIAP